MPEVLGGSLRRTGYGYEVGVRLPWYRALPLSCVGFGLTVDGDEVAPQRIRLHVNDRDYALEELAELYAEHWFVLDEAGLRVDADEPLGAGEHEVAVEVELRPPYIFDEETGEVVSFRRVAEARLTVS